MIDRWLCTCQRLARTREIPHGGGTPAPASQPATIRLTSCASESLWPGEFAREAIALAVPVIA